MQTHFKIALPVLTALAFAVAATSAHADSTSSALSTSSTSLGSSSTSIDKSSNSLSNNGRVAQGHYTIIEMAALPLQPGLVKLHLQAAAPALGDLRAKSHDFYLLLPRQAAERGQLAEGKVVSAQHRAYGVAFATLDATGAASPFFLVLDDAWHRELESRPVIL